MTDGESGYHVPDSIIEWFARRGFSLAISQSDGAFWADLLDAHGHVVAPRYGRGAAPDAAAERAMQRYLEEQ